MSHLSRLPAEPSDEPAGADDEVFKALADPSRRLLLDALFVDDGQTLGQLAARLSGMTRFGVMKHLRLLEAAGLVLSRKIGREKLHYLNPVPIRLIHDRWISKYAEPWMGALAGLKAALEGPSLAFEIYIRATPARVFRAIVHVTLTELASVTDTLESEPPRRLAQAWSSGDDPPSRVTWHIDALGDICRLTLVHDGFESEMPSYRAARDTWPRVLSSLKSLLETGRGLAYAEQ